MKNMTIMGRSGANGRGLFLFSALVFFLTSTGITLAQDEVKTTLEEDKLGGIVFEKRVEERLSRDISSYLGHSRFILRVDAEIFDSKTETIAPKAPEPVAQPLAQEQSQIQQQPLAPQTSVTQFQPVLTPEQQFQQNRFIKRRVTSEDSGDSASGDDFGETLPGLPFSDLGSDFGDEDMEDDAGRAPGQKRTVTTDETFIPPAATIVQQQPVLPMPVQAPPVRETKQEIEKIIRKIFVTFMVDRNITSEQESFIKNLVYKKLDMDVTRGDGFEVIKIDFPAEKVPMDDRKWENLAIALLGIMLLLMLVTIFGIFFRNWSAARKLRKEKIAEAQRIAREKSESLSEAEKRRGLIDEEKKLLKLQMKREQYKQEIVSLGVGKPRLLNSRIKEELESSEGVKKAAILFSVLGFNLGKSIFSELSVDRLIEIETVMKEEEIGEEETVQYLERFHDDTMRKILMEDHGAKKQKVKPFSFLNDLDEAQITYLVKEEEIKVKALILSQLSPERMAGVLKNLPIEEQASIAYELAKFESIPINAFQPVAQRIARRAIDVPSLENITADGVGIMVSMMDFMDMSSQTTLLEHLKSEDPETYHLIKKVYFTFTDIPKVPRNVLKDSIRDLERSTIAKSLVQSDKNVQTAILSALNEDARRIVRDEYKIVAKDATVAEVDQAKIAVVTRVRGFLKSGAFSMEDLDKTPQQKAAPSDPTEIRY